MKKVCEIQVKYSSKLTNKNRFRVLSSKDAFQVINTFFNWDLIEYQELFYVLFLNRGNFVLGYKLVSMGGIHGTIVDKRQIFGLACKTNSHSLIFCHNHPSGNNAASQADLDLTKDLVKAGQLLDIAVLDHLIITPEGKYVSFSTKDTFKDKWIRVFLSY